MSGRLLFWAAFAWPFLCSTHLTARTVRDAERVKAIEQMERRLQTSAAAKRTPLSSKTASSPSPAPVPVKPSPNLLERLFGKVSPAPEPPSLRPVSGKRPSSSRKPVADSTVAAAAAVLDSGMSGSLALPANAPGNGRAAASGLPEPVPAAAKGGADLRKMVSSLLSRMTPVTGGWSDDAVMEAGSYQFEDYVYEQRRRDGDFEKQAGAAVGSSPGGRENGAQDRLLRLLAPGEVDVAAPVASVSPEKKRESSTAKLASASIPAAEDLAALVAGAGEDAPVPQSSMGQDGEAGAVPADGQSATYRKALAKLRTIEAPTPPPLRAVSGFQGLMTAKPSEQSVEQDRAGVLSALKME